MIFNIPNTIRFSIADADYYFKEIMVKSLLADPFCRIVNNCNNGYELINQIYRKQENILLIDLYMPVLSGIETIKFIRNTGNRVPVITYSPTYQDDMYTLLKTFSGVFYCQKKSTIILNMLRNCVCSQSMNYSDYLQQWAKQSSQETLEYMERQRKAWYEPSLTEIQIMKLCYEGMNNKEMAQYLHLSSRTIETYITRLLQKLGLRNKTDLIRFCVEQGYYNSST